MAVKAVRNRSRAATVSEDDKMSGNGDQESPGRDQPRV